MPRALPAMGRGRVHSGAALCRAALLLPEAAPALRPWLDGTWYDAPQDFNVAVPICKIAGTAEPPYCPTEWHYFNGSCYIATTRICEWREAVETCSESYNAKLASITSAQENEEVRSLCGARMCWLGLKERRGLEDAWQWLDGSPIGYWNWHKGEPSNSYGIEFNVVIMNFGWKRYAELEQRGGWANGDWYDVGGSFNKPSPICERDMVRRHRANYCADGWEENAGSCYHLLDWNCTYAEASASCEREGAHLVSIRSEEEQMFVRSLCGPRMCWLGLRQEEVSKAWLWSDDSSMVYANWARGEPNNVGGHENAAMMNLDAGWAHGRGSRWRNPQQRKNREAFRQKFLVIEESLALKFRLGAMALFSVAYMASYIARSSWGVRNPGGPKDVALAALVVVLAGRLLDHLLCISAGATMVILLILVAAEGLYIGGLHTWRPSSSSLCEGSRSPDLGSHVLE